jgi:hypothetical protein
MAYAPEKLSMERVEAPPFTPEDRIGALELQNLAVTDNRALLLHHRTALLAALYVAAGVLELCLRLRPLVFVFERFDLASRRFDLRARAASSQVISVTTVIVRGNVSPSVISPLVSWTGGHGD